MQNILVVSEKNSFLTISMMEQLRELGYEPTSAELNIEEISKAKGVFEVILLYMESDGVGKSKELVYLRDKAVEEDCPIFYVGEDTEEIRKSLPSHVLEEIFERPIDVRTAMKTIDEFIKEHGKHVKKKILVVDDSGIMLRNMKRLLEDKYQVILANSGTMAIKYLATNRPDLVLLDYEMPVVDGSQVLEMIRSETEFCDIPVIFLTGKNDKESIMKVLDLKPEGYLLKSMESAQILKAIEEFFEKQKCV